MERKVNLLEDYEEEELKEFLYEKEKVVEEVSRVFDISEQEAKRRVNNIEDSVRDAANSYDKDLKEDIIEGIANMFSLSMCDYYEKLKQEESGISKQEVYYRWGGLGLNESIKYKIRSFFNF